MPERSKLPTRRHNGFTLIETLVAFTILALALATLFGAFSSGLLGEKRAGTVAGLTLAARSLIAEAGRASPLQEGRSAGELSGGATWEMTVSQVEPVPISDITRLAVAAYRVEVEVASGTGTVLRFRTLRLAAAP